jgi:hypothetical protein
MRVEIPTNGARVRKEKNLALSAFAFSHPRPVTRALFGAHSCQTMQHTYVPPCAHTYTQTNYSVYTYEHLRFSEYTHAPLFFSTLIQEGVGSETFGRHVPNRLKLIYSESWRRELSIGICMGPIGGEGGLGGGQSFSDPQKFTGPLLRNCKHIIGILSSSPVDRHPF